jgi:hypothetical protein
MNISPDALLATIREAADTLFLAFPRYISASYLCFYSSVFGYETKAVIPISDVVSAEKRMTALIFPNAIEG